MDINPPGSSQDGTAGAISPEALATLPHDSLSTELNATIWSLNFLAFAFVGLRIYLKLSRGRKLWWDDYVLLASFVSPSGHCTGTPSSSSCILSLKSILT